MDDDHAAVWDDVPSSSTTRLYFEPQSATERPAEVEEKEVETEPPRSIDTSLPISVDYHTGGGFGTTPELPNSFPPPQSDYSSLPLRQPSPIPPSPFASLIPSSPFATPISLDNPLSSSRASDHDDFYSSMSGLRVSEKNDIRASTDNASIIPIPPSETGTIRSLDDDAEERAHALAPHGTSNNAWNMEPPSVTSGSSSGAFYDPLHAVPEPVMHTHGYSQKKEQAKKEERREESVEDETSVMTEYDFEVIVSEPQKIGDPLSAHVAYKVKTRTNAPTYRNQEFAVTRRYRDFLWLYNQLTTRYSGIIVPPVPEKHAIGRFQDDFVESRRFALEKCIRKIVAHPLLQVDDDLRMFLESESFAVDKRKEESSKGGFMAAFNTAISTAAAITTSRIENDQIFEGRRDQIDAMDGQLRSMLKALESLSKYRKDLGSATFEFGESLIGLASVEVNKPVSSNLLVLGGIQKKVKDIHDKQAKQDMYHIISVVDEHVRIINSVKLAFNSRLRAYQAWQTSESTYIRKKEALDRIKTTAKVRSDKIAIGSVEVEELEKQVIQNKKTFEDVTLLLRAELERYEKEKVVDFTIAIQGFLRSLIETQKEIIALWQSYHADIGGNREAPMLGGGGY
ncbi:Vacuolar protein sorting-associated protein 5 [Phlyctochytrium planicorne]|nr:Vacuolar protein sorting-associated protein 5 [Phlyctochytrium planicorne]